MNVDILFSIVGTKPPRLPLREERQTDGVEIVYNAAGTGRSAVCAEQRKREKLLLEKLSRLEKKLERKPSYKRTKKREKALQMVKDLKRQLEDDCESGISYDQYLDELRKMRKEAKRAAKRLSMLQKQNQNQKQRDLQLDVIESANVNKNGGGNFGSKGASVSMDESSCMSEASCSTVHIESKVMKALQTLFDDPELDDINDDDDDDDDDDDHHNAHFDIDMLNMDNMDDRTADETTSDVNTTGESLLSVDCDSSTVKNSHTCNTEKDESLLSYNNNENELQEDEERDELEEDHKRWEEQTLPETISTKSRETTHTSKTKRTSNCDDNNDNGHRTLDTVQSGKSTPSTVRFKGVKPTVDDHLARAKALLNNAKDLQKSFSNDTDSVASVAAAAAESIATANAHKEQTEREVIPSSSPVSPQRHLLDAPIVNEKERYHLFLSHACPYSHRVVIIHALKRLHDYVSVSYVRCKWDPIPLWGDSEGNGTSTSTVDIDVNNETSFWSISKENYNDNDDAFESFKIHYLDQEMSTSNLGPISIRVPVLWDKKEKRVVCNRCTDMMRVLNFEFNMCSKRPKLNLFPAGFKRENEDIDKWIHEKLFIPIYKCGLCRSQSQYDEAIQQVTDGLDRAEQIVKKRGFLAGQKLTESDLRLFVLLLRFDEVYRILFKVNTRMVEKMTGLMDFMRDIYSVKGVVETCDMEKIKREFYGATATTFIVPRGRFVELLAVGDSI